MRSRSLVRFACLLLVLASCTGAAPAQNAAGFPYQRPPKVIADILEAPATPLLLVSPARDRGLLASSLRNPPVADLAQPALRIAGLRINPATNGPHRPTPRNTGLTLVTIADGKQQKIALPEGAILSAPSGRATGRCLP